MPHSLTGPNPMPSLPKAFDDPEAHEQLLSDWLDWRDAFPSLAVKHGLTIDQLLDWHQSDQIQLRLKRLADMAQARAFYLAQLHRTTAVTRLNEVINDTRSVDAKDRVRAATQLLRLAKQADDQQPRSAPSAYSASSEFTSSNDQPAACGTTAPRTPGERPGSEPKVASTRRSTSHDDALAHTGAPSSRRRAVPRSGTTPRGTAPHRALPHLSPIHAPQDSPRSDPSPSRTDNPIATLHRLNGQALRRAG